MRRHQLQNRITSFSKQHFSTQSTKMKVLLASLPLLFQAAHGWTVVSKTYHLDDLPEKSSSWLIRGGDVDKGHWGITQLDFFQDKACTDKVDLSDVSFTSSVGPVNAANAFDNDPSTAWIHDGQFSFFLGFDNGPNVDVKCIMLEYVPDWDKKDMPQFFLKKHDQEKKFAAPFEVKGVSEGKNFIDLTVTCTDHILTFWGDGVCSPELRSDECGWDGGDCGDVEYKDDKTGLIVGIVIALCIVIACAALFYFIKKRREEKLLPYIAKPVSSTKQGAYKVSSSEPEFENSPRLVVEDEERVYIMAEAVPSSKPEFENSPRLEVEDEERVRIMAEAARLQSDEEERARVLVAEAANREEQAQRTRIEEENQVAARTKFLEDERLRTEAVEVAKLKLLEEEQLRSKADEATGLSPSLRIEAADAVELEKALDEEGLRVDEAEEQKEKNAAFNASEAEEAFVEDLQSNTSMQVRLRSYRNKV